MKYLMELIVGLMALSHSSNAQHPVLYGTNDGGIYKFVEKDNELSMDHRFKNAGEFTGSYMVAGKDGTIYGVARGGPYGFGVIYTVDPVTNKYKIIKNFHGTDGVARPSALVRGRDGTLYGTGGGGIFSIDPGSNNFRIIYKYDTNLFTEAVTMASDGRLYGIAIQLSGGSFLFSFDPESKEFRAEVSVPFEIGSFLSKAMIDGNDGNLYGLTTMGGDNDLGTLFSYSLKSKQVTKRFDFNSTSGVEPNGTLTLGSDGKLYSTTSSGGASKGFGTIFCFDPKNNSLKVIHDFDVTTGTGFGGGLVEGEGGKLYGMCRANKGSIFYSIDKDGKNYEVIRDFEHPGGVDIDGNLVQVGHRLYGVAIAERNYPYPYIFSYDRSQNLFQKIIRTNQDKGYDAIGTLLQARDGRLYGLVRGGGSYGSGGIFSYNPGTRLYSMLLPFNNERGYVPQNDLVQAPNGKLYGLTFYGGKQNNGVIFSYDPQKSRYVIEKNLEFPYHPVTGFSVGIDGNLYSIIQEQVGTDDDFYYDYHLVTFNPATRKYKLLKKLCCGMGGEFSPASDGKLYASSPNGVYCYDPLKNKLDHFPNPIPYFYFTSDKLVEAADHKLYGIYSSGGVGGDGLIYSFDPKDQSITEVFAFNQQTTGRIPYGGLLVASDGKLYGKIADVGPNRSGSLFSFDPFTHSFRLLHIFDRFSEGFSGSGQLVELNTSTPPIVSLTDKKMYEGEKAELTVSLNRISMEEVKLNYRTVAGTATDNPGNPDYVPTSGQLIIPPGEISTKISVSLLEDELIENRETFTLVLQKANDAMFQLGDSIGVINIKNGTAPVIPPGGEIITIAPVAVAATESVNKDELVIRATPNPSSDFFSLHIAGNRNDRASVTVTNVSGQVMDKFNGAFKNGELTFGRNYPSGPYFVQVVVGENSRVLKLVKTP